MYFVTVILNVKSKCNYNYIYKKKGKHTYTYTSAINVVLKLLPAFRNRNFDERKLHLKQKKVDRTPFNKTHPVSDGKMISWYHLISLSLKDYTRRCICIIKRQLCAIKNVFLDVNLIVITYIYIYVYLYMCTYTYVVLCMSLDPRS